VLEGKAHFLLQKKTLADLVLVLATTGDIVLISPGYGHVTINPATGRNPHDGKSGVYRIFK
jgi:glucose-6-phosphate isomerase, archaeal